MYPPRLPHTLRPGFPAERSCLGWVKIFQSRKKGQGNLRGWTTLGLDMGLRPSFWNDLGQKSVVSDGSLKGIGDATDTLPQGSLQRMRVALPIMHFLPSNYQAAYLLAEAASLEKRAGMQLAQSITKPLGATRLAPAGAELITREENRQPTWEVGTKQAERAQGWTRRASRQGLLASPARAGTSLPEPPSFCFLGQVVVRNADWFK